MTNAIQSGKVLSVPPMTKLLAILFWASLLGGALSIFLDPDFPGIFEIIERF